MEEKKTNKDLLPVDPFSEALFESEKMEKELKKEVDYFSTDLIKEPKNNCLRRVFIKSLFSYIEGVCFALKQVTLVLCSDLSIGEKNLLEEVEYYLNNKGELWENKKHLKPEYNLKFAFKMYAKAWKADDFKLEISTQGWEHYKKSKEVRNRITHPKNSSDLIIKDKEIEDTFKALDWFYGSLSDLFESCRKSLERQKMHQRAN